mgnify:CR=1 FL=1
METIRNADLPAIEIYCNGGEAETAARYVGYGIEEEGLPYAVIRTPLTGAEASELARRPGLGVVVLVTEEAAEVYTRLLKKQEPLFRVMLTDTKAALVAGKNAARIVKTKPFIEME